MTEDGLSFVARLPSPSRLPRVYGGQVSVVPKGRRVKVFRPPEASGGRDGGQALAKMEGQKFIHLWRNIKWQNLRPNGVSHPPKIMWEYGNGARFRTLRSTIVENLLQTCCDGRLSRRVADTAGSTASRPYFMQNKANLLKDKINEKFFDTKD